MSLQRKIEFAEPHLIGKMKDNLGARMKENYEGRAKIKLLRRIPVIIRLDGKAFHTFTRGFEKPFDKCMVKAMQETMQYLCKNIQGCVLGYTQSDEITLVLIDYQNLSTDAWFDYNVQKMCSISASMATLAFFRSFCRHAALLDFGEVELRNARGTALQTGAFFDSRCFNIPKEEVTNCILWRQQDATRNSIQAVGQANFSHKELEGLSCDQIQEKLLSEKGINWNDYPTTLKRGSCCIRKCIDGRTEWIIDNEIPIFKGDDRNYIENLINV